MTSGTESQDPFLVVPDRPKTSGKPVGAPPPTGQRFASPPPVSSNAPSPSAVDPSGYSTAPFTRTWKVTFRRWRKAWLAFLIVGFLFGAILAAQYPDQPLSDDTPVVSFYIALVLGMGFSYLLLMGWWFDHILATAGIQVSLVLQAILAGAIGLMANGVMEELDEPPLEFPLVYLFISGVLGVALAHFLGKTVEGSFKPTS